MKNSIILSGLLCFLVACNQPGSQSEATVSIQPQINSPIFTQLSEAETGIDFVNVNIDDDVHNVYKYAYYYNGGGVAIADFNNDALQDIVFTANMGDNKLYVNKGNFNFDNVTEQAKINPIKQGWTTGVTTLDINNDGFEDIFMCQSGYYTDKDKDLVRNLLYINNGDLTFTESAKDYGLDGFYYSTQACFFDLDNDGDLDLYLLNHPNVFKEIRVGKDNKLRKDLPNESKFSDQLFINNDGKFTNVTKKFGLENRAHGLGVVAVDYNNDGFKDLFVSNDFKMPNVLLRNDQGIGFTDVTKTAIKHMAKFSMGCDFGDINNDGYQDIISLEMLAEDNFRKKTNMMSMNTDIYWEYVENGKHYQDMHNCLQLNNTNETFSEIAWLSNVAETDWSWSPLLADFDNDGYQDLYITNGFKKDIHNKDFVKSKEMEEAKKNKDYSFTLLTEKLPSSKVSNYMYSNNGDVTFNDVTKEWGLYDPKFSYGSAYADFDNDGNLDLVVNNINDKAFVYKNNGSGNKYLKCYLKNGTTPAYGSKVEILDPDYYQAKELANAHGYLSKSEDVVHFGMGNKQIIDSIRVTWFDNQTTLLLNTPTNQNLTLNYKDAKFNGVHEVMEIKDLFFETLEKDFGINYVHQEKEHDDYFVEILLPHKLSQEGPFMDVADVNSDGLDDFYVGNGNGYAGQLYVQEANGSFKQTNLDVFKADMNCEDIGVLFFDYDGDNDQDLYVVSGSNEYPVTSINMVDRLYQNDGKGNFTKTKGVIPSVGASGSCVVSGDVDGDGDLDLFIGGYTTPSWYPNPGKSSLLINENGVFKDKIKSMAPDLEEIGMVKDAQFADLNKDGKLDLVVAGHWMPMTVFEGGEGTLVNKTETYGLSETVGWWNTVFVEDFNDDGALDFAAGNLGLNTKHKATKEGPFKIMSKDFDGNGTNDIALGYYKQGNFYPVRGRECTSQQIPDVKENFKSYTEFGNASFEELYSHYDQSNVLKYEATMFETSLFLQDNLSFTPTAFPIDCQFAPTNDFLSVDTDRDGRGELVSVGNLFPVEVETGRYDAHIGNVVSIGEAGQLKSVPYVKSGFFSDGDARSIQEIVIAGKAYIMVTNNRGKLQIVKLNDASSANSRIASGR